MTRKLTPSERMLEILRYKFKLKIPAEAKIERTYAGYWQRSSGAFSWMIVAEGFGSVGSQNSITNLLRCPKLELGEEYGQYTIDCGCRGVCEGGKK